MANKFYDNYYTQNPIFSNMWDIKDTYKFWFSLLKNNIEREMINLSKDITILEIWSWTGNFANYCDVLWFKWWNASIVVFANM